MDEPTASFDGDTGHSHRRFCEAQHSQRKAMHSDRHARRQNYEFATRILKMEDGRLTGVCERRLGVRRLTVCTILRRALSPDAWSLICRASRQPPLPPAFTPPTNPYPNGIYAEGILESDQPSGENINVYPEVSGTVKQILVAEGQEVKKGTVLLLLDDSIQRATVEQLESQTQAAFTLLQELKAQPRKETLDVAEAQVVSAQAALKTAQDALDKQQAAYDMDPKSISKDALDSAANAVATAQAESRSRQQAT